MITPVSLGTPDRSGPAGAVSAFLNHIEVAPRVHLATLSGTPTPAQFAICLDEAAAWLGTLERPIGVMVDATAMPSFDARYRSIYSDWRAAKRPLIQSRVRRAGYVVDGSVRRGMLTAIFWILQPVVPVRVFLSRDAALAWLKGTTDGGTLPGSSDPGPTG